MNDQHRAADVTLPEPSVNNHNESDLTIPENSGSRIPDGQQTGTHLEQPSGEHSNVIRSDSSHTSSGTTQPVQDTQPALHEAPHGDQPISTTALLPNPNKTSAPIRQPRSRLSRYLSDWWLLECLSWILCILSIIAIIIILRIYDQKRLPQWPLSITINTAISVFATISQIAMLVPVVESLSQLKWIWFTKKPQCLTDFDTFDQASRGAIGSLLLMIKLRGMYVHRCDISHWAD